MKPLTGYKILELSHYIAGPMCGQILADFGGEVTKVEPPSGDPSRNAYPVREGASAYFAASNQGKQHITLDLKNGRDLDEFLDLVAQADAVVTNYAKGVPEKLRIPYNMLRRRNPRLVYTHITGFGARENDPSEPAYDGVIQAMSGLASLTGERDRAPHKAGVFIADHLSAWVAATGTLIALEAARKTGESQFVDISMLDALFTTNHFNVPLVSDFEKVPTRSGNRSSNVLCTTFPTSDGWIYIAPITEGMWSALCRLIGRPELADEEVGYVTNDMRLSNYDFLEDAITEYTKTVDTYTLSKQLKNARVAAGIVQDVREAMESDEIRNREMVRQVVNNGQVFNVPSTPIRINSGSTER